jgi:membrane protein GlpM
MSILVKAIIGGLMTALIASLSTRGNVLPGIVPLFPTLTLITLCIVGSKGDPHGFQETCIATLKTLPAYVVFVVVCYLSIRRVSSKAALLLGLTGWLVAALIMFLVPRAWQRIG